MSVITNFISSLRSALGSVLTTTPHLVHPWNLPLPKVLHRMIDEKFLDNFEEVLVIGDVHGCYDEMVQLIQVASEKENSEGSDGGDEKILKLFVGDLINKGPKSKEVIQFMLGHQESCFPVRGNHDEVVLREYFKYKNDPTSLEAKNDWIKELTQEEIDYLVALPYTIQIPSLKIIVVHAGLVPNVPIEEQLIVDMLTMRNLVSEDGLLKGISSDESGEPWAGQWPGPEHVYFGHDAKRKLQQFEYATGLDTGCVYGNCLTASFVWGPRQGQMISLKANKIHQIPKG